MSVRTPVYANRFERDLKLRLRRGKDAEKFKPVAWVLLDHGPLPPHYRDHPLRGGFAGWRDCHLEPDWILIYRRTATHSDLFR